MKHLPDFFVRLFGETALSKEDTAKVHIVMNDVTAKQLDIISEIASRMYGSNVSKQDVTRIAIAYLAQTLGITPERAVKLAGTNIELREFERDNKMRSMGITVDMRISARDKAKTLPIASHGVGANITATVMAPTDAVRYDIARYVEHMRSVDPHSGISMRGVVREGIELIAKHVGVELPFGGLEDNLTFIATLLGRSKAYWGRVGLILYQQHHQLDRDWSGETD